MDLPNFSLEDDDMRSIFITQNNHSDENNGIVGQMHLSDISDDDDFMDFEVPSSQPIPV